MFYAAVIITCLLILLPNLTLKLLCERQSCNSANLIMGCKINEKFKDFMVRKMFFDESLHCLFPVVCFFLLIFKSNTSFCNVFNEKFCFLYCVN